MFIIKVFKAKEANNPDNNKGNRIRAEFYNACRSHNYFQITYTYAISTRGICIYIYMRKI